MRAQAWQVRVRLPRGAGLMDEETRGWVRALTWVGAVVLALALVMVCWWEGL